MKTLQDIYRIEQAFKYQDDNWWKWSIWIEGEDSDLDLIDYVVYTLHSTFPNPVRKMTNRDEKFKLSTEGWGVFRIYAKLGLKDEREIMLEHDLSLQYPDGRECTD